ncbi:MAG: hypothetical protein KGZ54_09920 [Dethiobacter sp.]|nr:hypothetical protein [Dethiobacter sp.]MBS3902317.1 hypothetical protein [Dethiobacter sp.]MBS3989392.1 hypothetical protein [Dethiobacter sp.]
MNVSVRKVIMAAVAIDGKKVSGVPVFSAQNEEEQANIATILSRVLEAVVHDMGNGVYIVVRH